MGCRFDMCSRIIFLHNWQVVAATLGLIADTMFCSNCSQMGVIWSPRGHLTVFADIFICHDLGDTATAISGQRPGMLPNLHNAQDSPPWQSSPCLSPNVNSAKAEKACSRRRARADSQRRACDDGGSGGTPVTRVCPRFWSRPDSTQWGAQTHLKLWRVYCVHKPTWVRSTPKYNSYQLS